MMACSTAIAAPDRITRCRHLEPATHKRGTSPVLGRCTGEALDPLGEILICRRHAALVLELITHAQATQEQP